MARRPLGVAGLIASLAGACAGTYVPPFAHAASVPPPPGGNQAVVVFLWPATSCDPGGYVTIATTEGRFVGNVASGDQLRAPMPAGDVMLVAWSPPQEQGTGAIVPSAVGVLRATLAPGRTYYVRLAFGEWDEQGPRRVWSPRRSTPWCEAAGDSTSEALVALRPGSREWSEVPAWTATFLSLASDPAAGQAWLDAHPDVVQARCAVARARFAGLRAEARGLATIEASDATP